MGRASEGFDLYTYLFDPPGCALAHTQRTAAPAPRNTGQTHILWVRSDFTNLLSALGGSLPRGGQSMRGCSAGPGTSPAHLSPSAARPRSPSASTGSKKR